MTPDAKDRSPVELSETAHSSCVSKKKGESTQCEDCLDSPYSIARHQRRRLAASLMLRREAACSSPLRGPIYFSSLPCGGGRVEQTQVLLLMSRSVI